MADQDIVERYSVLARAALAGETIRDCSGDEFDGGCFGTAGYDDLLGLPARASQASLGCGNPLAVADLHAGETVLDLGSGGGIDVLLSARRVGPDGYVYGVDASADMLELARSNAEQAGAANVEFLHGSIEDLPMPANSVDVVISNCVINLSPDKAAVFAEVVRVLRAGGRLGISDVIADDDSPPGERVQAAHRVGCVAGVLTVGEYRSVLVTAGLADVAIERTADHGDGVHSAIVQARKPTTAG
jgi:SAM-dependent methyltransferase